MTSILFTDSDGTWKLTNGKSWPANRFGNWTPQSRPIGDAVARQSDGALTMFRLRDDFGVTFEVPLIGSRRRSNLLLWTEQIDNAGGWSSGGAPTVTADVGVAPDGSTTADRVNDTSAAANQTRLQTVTVAADTSSYVCSVHFLQESAVFPALALKFTDGVTPKSYGVGIDYAGGVVAITADPAGGTWLAPTTIGVEYAGRSWWRAWMIAPNLGAGYVTAVTTLWPAARATGSATIIANAPTGSAQIWGAMLHTGSSLQPYLMTQGAALSNIAPVETADRLRYWLMNGGTCSVYTNDTSANAYATCGLAPGTQPDLVLTNRKTLEYTLSLQLINLAGSPTRMLSNYIEQ